MPATRAGILAAMGRVVGTPASTLMPVQGFSTASAATDDPAFNALQTIEGMSDITLNEEGRILSHLDYWDSLNGLYVKLPFIGLIYRISLRMFKVKIN